MSKEAKVESGFCLEPLDWLELMMPLKPQDKAPDFSLLDQDGNQRSLADYKGKIILLYFYPKANTPGCTKQSCLINDSLAQLNKLNVEAIGISPDAVAKQKKFAEKFGLQFALLSDEDHTIAELYDVWGEKKMYGKSYMGIIRSAFLIDEDGVLIDVWYKVSPKDTVDKAMAKL